MIRLKDLLNEAKFGGENPLDGKSKTNAKNWVHGKVDKMTKGIWGDEYWQPIARVFKEMDKLQLNWHQTGAKYQQETVTFADGSRHSVPVRKIWTFEVDFINNRDKKDTLYGRIVAAGAGSVEEPLAKYDVVFTIS
jgi:hypothetical protein